jgi:hypothetical protein
VDPKDFAHLKAPPTRKEPKNRSAPPTDVKDDVLIEKLPPVLPLKYKLPVLSTTKDWSAILELVDIITF